MSVCLSAHTASTRTGYPEYISINHHGDRVAVTVRAPATEQGLCGDSATISLSLEDFRAIFSEALMNSP